MQEISTARLYITQLKYADRCFIYELVNSPGWIRFIGDRHIRCPDDANTYIGKVLSNPDVCYWVVKLKADDTPIGIITLIKRDYLDHPDLGYAFLGSYTKMGFAYEAAHGVLTLLHTDRGTRTILATTDPENGDSVRLLGRLGFYFLRTIVVEQKILQLYCSRTALI